MHADNRAQCHPFHAFLSSLSLCLSFSLSLSLFVFPGRSFDISSSSVFNSSLKVSTLCRASFNQQRFLFRYTHRLQSVAEVYVHLSDRKYFKKYAFEMFYLTLVNSVEILKKNSERRCICWLENKNKPRQLPYDYFEP